MKIQRISLAILFLACSGLAQERFVKPSDDAAKDPSFLAFRTKLIAAAEMHDSAFILRILDPKIELSFGGDKGVKDFIRIWKINSRNSPFWPEFLAVIKNGGSFDNPDKVANLFVAPYLFSSWPDDLDLFEYHAIFGNNVNLRKQPRRDAEVVAQLSYNVVQIEPETVSKSGKSGYPEWWEVKTLGGLKGYVKREYVRGPIDYRAGFEKKRGQWKMTFFLAGD